MRATANGGSSTIWSSPAASSAVIRAASDDGVPTRHDRSISSAVTLFAGFPDADLQLFLEALVDNQYLRVLSEPTLVAVSGEATS